MLVLVLFSLPLLVCTMFQTTRPGMFDQGRRAPLLRAPNWIIATAATANEPGHEPPPPRNDIIRARPSFHHALRTPRSSRARTLSPGHAAALSRSRLVTQPPCRPAALPPCHPASTAKAVPQESPTTRHNIQPMRLGAHMHTCTVAHRLASLADVAQGCMQGQPASERKRVDYLLHTNV